MVTVKFLLVAISCGFVRGFKDSQNIPVDIEENVGNSHVTEGDIYLDKSTREILDNLQRNRHAREVINNPVKHWPGGRVAYRFGRVSSAVRSAFRRAINDYNRYTCIRIVPRTRERDYIEVVSEGGCWSAIGRSGGRQKLSLGRDCEHKGTAIHELMHVLGFFHEQSRLDRDQYITIVWNNIKPKRHDNFKKYRHGEADTLGEPYDYNSLMHYHSTAFSINGRATIVPKRRGVRIGQRRGFSRVDINQINKMYRCKGGVKPTRPRPRPPTRPRIRPPTRPPVVSCADKKLKCRSWASKGFCFGRYGTYMRKNCRKSCGLCGGGVKPTCRDTGSYCSSYRGSRWLSHYCRYTYLIRNCKKLCGRC